MTQVAERHEAYIAAFEAFRRDPAFGSDALRRGRETAFDRFLERGFPTTRDEEWRFTNVAPIADTTFTRAAVSLPREALAPYYFRDTPTVLVVNGRVSRALSTLDALPAGVTVRTLADGPGATEFAGGSSGRHRLTNRSAPNAFADLNAAFFEDVVFLQVAPKTVVTTPIHILSIVATGTQPIFAAPRIVVSAGEEAQFTLIESYSGAGDGVSLTNAWTEIVLAPAAVVAHVKIQRESARAFHVANMTVTLDRASTFTSQAITFGGRIVRNDILAELAGEGAECTLNGLYLADGDTLVDTHTTIDHAMPHCPSHEVYKGILGGKARAVFNGKIIVRPDAQKTDAKQTNKALLLTDDAQINTKPQLEIFADDVKCTHGAAIGQLDEEAMFYLRARGLSETESRSLLIHAFAGEILNGIKVDAVRERVQHVMEEKLSISEQA